MIFLPVKTHIANTVDMHLHWHFLKQDWKEKAQKHREDLDMVVLEDMKCPTRKTVFKRMKDFKYHIKTARNVNVTFLDVGNFLTTRKSLKGTRTSFISNVLNVKFAAKYLQKRET